MGSSGQLAVTTREEKRQPTAAAVAIRAFAQRTDILPAPDRTVLAPGGSIVDLPERVMIINCRTVRLREEATPEDRAYNQQVIEEARSARGCSRNCIETALRLAAPTLCLLGVASAIIFPAIFC